MTPAVVFDVVDHRGRVVFAAFSLGDALALARYGMRGRGFVQWRIAL